jgi:uncharacterized protein YggT (Ycf19 family)
MSAPEAPYGESQYSRPATAARPPAAEPAREPPPSSRVPEAAVVSLWVGRMLLWLVYAFATVAAILLLIAFFLQLTGANPAAPFAAWVYRSSDVLLTPFRSLYPTAKVHDSRSVLNLSIVFAIFMYGLFAVLFAAAVGWFDHWIRGLQARSRHGAPATR